MTKNATKAFVHGGVCASWSILLREGNFLKWWQTQQQSQTLPHSYGLNSEVCIAYKGSERPIKSTKTHMLKRNACWHPRELSPRQGLGVWKATRSVWHWLFCANSTPGDALASFAANPGKEITDTHNAVFCLSAKKKTNPLSLYKRRYRHSHSLSPCPRSKPRLSFISRNMPSNMCLCSVTRSLKAP